MVLHGSLIPSRSRPPGESRRRKTAESLTTPGEYDNNGSRTGWSLTQLRPEQRPTGPLLRPQDAPRGGRNGFREGQFRRRQRAVTAGRRRGAGGRNRRDRRNRGRGAGGRRRGA